MSVKKVGKSKKRMPKEPKTSGYISGFLIMAFGLFGLMFIFFTTWAHSFDEVLTLEEIGLSRYSAFPLISIILSLSIVSGGIGIVSSLLLQDLEIIDKMKSNWIKHVIGILLFIPSLGLVAIGFLFMGILWSGSSVFFQTPSLLLFTGLLNLKLSSRIAKKNMRWLRYHIAKNKIHRKIPVKPIPIKKPRISERGET